MSKSSSASFLQSLQKQAHLQSKLNQQHFLPRQFDPFMAFIGNYPWQTVLVLSAITAYVWTLIVK